MSEPLSTEELMRLDAELAARVVRNPAPHPSLPATPGPGSNVSNPPPPAENARLVAQSLAMGLGRFRVSEHDHRLALERGQKSRT